MNNSPKTDLLYVTEIMNFSVEAISLVAKMKLDAFKKNRTVNLAVTHLVQNIGEAASHLSEEFKTKHRLVPWEKMIGIRNRIVHDYRKQSIDA